jgi:hypothetical protein
LQSERRRPQTEIPRAGFDEALGAWESLYDGLSDSEIQRQLLGVRVLLRGIARHGGISADEFGRELGLEADAAQAAFRSLVPSGLEVDDQGRIVGAALTVREKPHRVRLGDRQLYAWCALDTLFIPGLLGEDAEVESTCPVTGERIEVSVPPKGAVSWSPPGAVLSVVLPGPGDLGQTVGPSSPT